MRRIHFIGIKGVGMSALAIVAQGLGYQVSGSDVAEQFITDGPLAEAQITVYQEFAAEHITDDLEAVIVGAAYGQNNPEVAAAVTHRLPQYTYSEFLGLLSSPKKTLAVAGTHGKTTTTSILSYLLYHAGWQPSYVIGTGHVTGLPAHGQAGNGEFFVTEADDYKRAPDDSRPKFLDLQPYGAIITSIEHDHPDMYPTLQDCITAFEQFTGRVRENGFLVVNGDDKNIEAIIRRHPEHRFITYGFDHNNIYKIEDYSSNGRTITKLYKEGVELGQLETQLPGTHNQMNATAAVLTALEIGLDLETITKLLPKVGSVERRYQLVGTKGNQIVIDDYAHHPTAVSVTLQTARKQYTDRPIWCLFQSHTYSRTKALLDEFGQAFGDADVVIITDIFASARESEILVTTEQLVAAVKAHHPRTVYVPFAQLVEYLQAYLPPNGLLITMGAGDIYKVGRQYLGLESSDKEK